ncbi:MAG TPA: class I SAM-dependent methyltransferase [Clostridia bacterium]|nr:class I SAM-dependent methyltransferase [Clostridia bacterium]
MSLELDYQRIENEVKRGYAQATDRYRRDDEIEVTTENHQRLSRQLADICRTFSGPITVLDLGCGTGRYFHCLHNVRQLVGLDISEEMLAAARSPVRQDLITIGAIQLLRSNAYLTQFPAESFHFIYSLGMFGHGCPVTPEICNRLYDWLMPGGKLLFNTIDMAGTPLHYRIRRGVRRLVYPWIGRRLRDKLDQREKIAPLFCLTKGQLLATMSQSKFRDYSISSHRCKSPLWRGRHLECLASRPEGAGQTARDPSKSEECGEKEVVDQVPR